MTKLNFLGFSSALFPVERLGHFCPLVSIYNTEKCWINSLAVPDLSLFRTSFEPRVSHCLFLTLYFTLMEGNEKYNEEADRVG